MTVTYLDVPRARNKHALHPDSLLAVIVGGAVAAAIWPVYLMAQGPGLLQLTVLATHVCGMLAGYGVVVMIGLMSRPPALVRGGGADRLARWHAKGGRWVVSLAIMHACAATKAWADSRRERIWIATWHVVRLP